MNADLAAGITSVVGHLESHGLGPTALLVRDGGALGRTTNGMFASRLVLHSVDEVDVSVERDGDLHICDRELFG